MSTLFGGEYGNLKHYERLIITRYFEDYDLSGISEILRCGDELSQEMRKFIADVLEEKIKRPPGKRSSTQKRDQEIHWRVSYLLFRGCNLTSNSDTNGTGAGAIVGKIFQISEDAAIKAYQKIERNLKGHGTTGVDEIRQIYEEDAEVGKIIAGWVRIHPPKNRKS